MNKDIKDLTNFLIGTGGLSVSVVLGAALSVVSPPLGLIALIPALSSFKKFANGILGNQIKQSCFSITKNKKMKLNKGNIKVNYISQNVLELNKFFNARKDDNHERYFATQGLNMFQQLKQKDKKGNLIKYGTRSQGYTTFLLRYLERSGNINIINKEESKKKSNLWLERLLLGVKQRDRKITMHNIAFTLTDKAIDSNTINELVSKLKLDLNNYEIKEKNGKIYYNLNKDKKEEKKENILETSNDKVIAEQKEYLNKQRNAYLRKQEIQRNLDNVKTDEELNVRIDSINKVK